MRLVPNRGYRLLLTAGSVSQMGDWAAKIGLSVLVYQQSGSASAVGLVNAAMVVPWLGPGQWLASRCDRFDRRRLLISCDVLRGLTFVLIGLGHLPLWSLVALVVLTATIDSVFEVNRAALLADLVSRDDYADAVQVNHAVDQAAQLLGYASGGILAGTLGAGNALVINGLTFLASALLVAGIDRASTAAREVVQPSLRAAAAYLWSDRLSLVGVSVTVVAMFGVASVEYQAVIYGQVVAGLSKSGAGLLAAAVPAGTLVVLALARTAGSDHALLRRGSLIAVVTAAVGAALLASGTPKVTAYLGFAMVGAVIVVSSFANMVVGRRIPSEIRGPTFAVLQTVVFVAGSAGMASGGLASDLLSPKISAAGALSVVSIGCLVGLLALARINSTAGPERRTVTAAG
jgi:MFS family permease